MKIPSLKETEKENLDRRERRASHFYGRMTKRDSEALDGNKGNMGIKIRPPKPR